MGGGDVVGEVFIFISSFSYVAIQGHAARFEF